jgi:putative addiction module CopG family antidote
MNVSLKPEVQKFIDDQVKAGRFHSADELVETAINSMMFDDGVEVDSATGEALEEGEAQLERGEGRPWEDVKAELQAKHLQK